MKFYSLFPWTGTGKNANAYIYKTQFKKEIEIKLIKGQQITKDEISFDLICLKNVSKRFPDLMGSSFFDFFVSDKFRKTIESMESSENIRFISGSFAPKPKTYNLVNILNNVDCFDWDNSEYTTYSNPKVLKKIQKLVIIEDKVNDRNIFRISDYPSHVFISEKLKNAIEENEITGYTLKSPAFDITIS